MRREQKNKKRENTIERGKERMKGVKQSEIERVRKRDVPLFSRSIVQK